MKKLSEFVKRRYSTFSKIFMLSIVSATTFSMDVFAADGQAYVDKTKEILGKLEGYALALIGVITVIKVIQYAIQYQGGSDDEKLQAVKLIRKTLIMGAGIFFLVWLAGYVIAQFSAVK